MHEDDPAKGAEDEIWFSRQALTVQPIAARKAERAYGGSNRTFGPGIARFYRPHHCRTLHAVENVGPHQAILRDATAPTNGESRFCESQRTTGTHTASPTRWSAAVWLAGSG